MNYLFLLGKKIFFESIQKGDFLKENLSEYEKKTLIFCQNWLNEQKEFIIYTSGSTGTPKALTLQREQLKASAWGTIQALDLQPNSRSLICINTAYVGGMMMLVRGFELGMEMHLILPSGNPIDDLRKYYSQTLTFDFIALVPLQIQNILSETPHLVHFLNPAKAIIVGGAAVSYALQKQISMLEAPVYSTYGMTETVSHIALQRLNGEEKQDYFKILPNIEIKTDERNCLQIKASLTNNKWLISNDLVELIDSDKFRYLGRIDNVINSGGVKIHIEQVEKKIEAIFNDLKISASFIVSSLADEKLGQKVILLIENEPFTIELEERLYQVLKQELDKYEVPKKIIYLKQFIRTDTDKINRKLSTQQIQSNSIGLSLGGL